jgi:hypothetical protein
MGRIHFFHLSPLHLSQVSPHILNSYEHSYERRSSILFLCTAKTMPLYQGLVLLLMNTGGSLVQVISSAFARFKTTKFLAGSSKGNTVGASMRTFAHMAIRGLKELRLPLSPVVFTLSRGRHHQSILPCHLTDKVALTSFFHRFLGANFVTPRSVRSELGRYFYVLPLVRKRADSGGRVRDTEKARP